MRYLCSVFFCFQCEHIQSNTLKSRDKIQQKHQCLILFVDNEIKRTEEKEKKEETTRTCLRNRGVRTSIHQHHYETNDNIKKTLIKEITYLNRYFIIQDHFQEKNIILYTNTRYIYVYM